jgi:hypothetical protein
MSFNISSVSKSIMGSMQLMDERKISLKNHINEINSQIIQNSEKLASSIGYPQKNSPYD